MGKYQVFSVKKGNAHEVDDDNSSVTEVPYKRSTIRSLNHLLHARVVSYQELWDNLVGMALLLRKVPRMQCWKQQMYTIDDDSYKKKGKCTLKVVPEVYLRSICDVYITYSLINFYNPHCTTFL